LRLFNAGRHNLRQADQNFLDHAMNEGFYEQAYREDVIWPGCLSRLIGQG